MSEQQQAKNAIDEPSDKMIHQVDDDSEEEEELSDEEYNRLYQKSVLKYNQQLEKIYEKDPSLKPVACCLLDHMKRENLLPEDATNPYEPPHKKQRNTN